MDIRIVVNKLIMLAFIMIIGYVSRKVNLLNQTYNKAFSTFLLNITLPCLVIDSILSTSASIEKEEMLQLMIIAICIYTLLIMLSLFLSKIFRPSKIQDGLYKFLTLFNNNMFMGFPIILSVLGEKAGFYCAIFNIINTLFMFSIGTYFMKKHNDSGKISLKKFINPVIISSVICTILYFFGYKTPILLEEGISQLGAVTIPLSMIVLGVSLAEIPVIQVVTDVKIYVFIVIKTIIIPLLIYFVLSNTVDNQLIIYTIVVVLAMPGPTLAVSMATEYDGDIMLASKYVFLSTVLSLVTIPFVISIII